MREKGLAQLAMVETHEVLEAEWLVENSPAHAVLAPYGIAEMSAAYRLLDAAREVGTGILATRPPGATSSMDVTDLQLRLSDERIAAAIEPLPRSDADLAVIQEAMKTRLSAERRRELWDDFTSRVPPPPPLRSGHPPEYGA